MKSNQEPVILDNWLTQKLGDMCSTFKSGLGITSDNISKEAQYPVYGGNGLRGYTDSYTHDGHYILIGRQGALCGNVMLVTGRNYISEHAIAVQTDEFNDANFLLYKLQYLNLNRLSESSAQPGLSVEKLVKIKLSIPPLPEQKAIAHILNSIDSAIHHNGQLIFRKELRKKWLMQNLLTGRKRLKGFNTEWENRYLGEMFIERNDTRFHDLLLLSIGANGVYPQTDSTKKDSSNEDKSKYKRICPGDIGYNTMRMWQGRSALSLIEGIVSPAYTVITPKEKADSNFFSYLFKAEKTIHLFWRNSQGLVDDTLNCKFKDFSIIKLNLPNKEEQTAIAQILQLADKEIQLLKKKTERLKEQKKGLMQVLLTGKVRVSNAVLQQYK